MKKSNKNLAIASLATAFILVLGLNGPTAAHAAGPAPINLLSSGNFVILSETGITDTGSHSSAITGNIGSSPITAAAMNDIFCSEITGTIYGVDAAYIGSGTTTCFAGNPPSANKTLVDNAVLDMQTAYNDAAGRTDPTATELGAGNIGGMTLAPGLYKWSTDVDIPTDVTLSGGPNDVWIFQIAGNLNISSGASVPAGIKVLLAGGAQASNVFWQVGGVTGATLGTYSTFNGTILSAKQVIIQTGAVLNGRALAQTQVTLEANTISIPSGSITPITPTSTPAIADIAIVKTANVTSTTPGGAVNYTVKVTDNGPATSTDVVGTDVLPTGLTFESATASVGTYATSTGMWTIGTLNPSSTATLTIDTLVNSTGTASTTITNRATVSESASTTDPSLANNSSSISVFIFPPAVVTPTSTPTSTADLSITKTVDNANPKAGDDVNYTLTAIDLGPATSTDVVATDTLPVGLTFVSATTSKGSYASSTGTWTIGTLSASSSATLTITALVNASGTAGTTITNTTRIGESASTTDPNLSNNSSSVSIVVQSSGGGGGPCATPLTESQFETALKAAQIGLSNVKFGTSTASFTVTNGASCPLPMVSLSSYKMFLAPGAPGWVTTQQFIDSTSTPLVAVGASTTLTVDVASCLTQVDLWYGAAPTSLNTTSTFTYPDNPFLLKFGAGGSPLCTSTSTPISTPTSTFSADIAIVKTVDDVTPAVGDTINYTLTATNLSTSTTSTDIVATDTWPSGLTFISATSSVGSYASSTGTWTIGALSPSSTATLSIAALVNSGTGGDTITNTAVISASSTSSAISDSSAISITVQSPGCASNCGGGGGTVGVGGGGSSYAISIDNGASSTATTNATLALYGTGAYTMQLSSSSNFSNAPWISYVTMLPWTLTSTNGEQTIYVNYRNVQGEDIGSANTSIDLITGGVSGGSTTGGGQVLGASTSCGLYLDGYIRMGWNNNSSQVEKLETFLNGNLGTDLPVTGVYNQQDFNAVEQFQIKYGPQVLAPWIPLGLPNQTTPTGFVYQTTEWWINNLVCEALNLPMPSLTVYQDR